MPTSVRPTCLTPWSALITLGAVVGVVASSSSADAGETTLIRLNPVGTTTAAAPEVPGLGVTELVALALEANRQLAIDRTRIGEAEALYSLAAAQAYPSGSVQGLFGGPTGEARTTVINDIDTVTPGSLENDFNFGGLGVTFRATGQATMPLYTFGKISAAKDAARHLTSAAQEKVRITAGEVALNVHRAFWAYQLASSFATSLAEGEKILAGVLERVEELLDDDSPQVTENDRLRLIHAHATLLVRLSEAQEGTRLAKAALHLLINRPHESPLEIRVADISEVGGTPEAAEQLVRVAIDHRPELRALRRLIEAQGRWADFRSNGFYPDLFAGAFLSYAVTTNATDQTNPFIDDDFNFFDAGFGVGVRLELDFFTKAALLEQAEAELRTRAAETDAALQAVELEVRVLRTQVAGRHARIERLTRALRAARGWLSAAVLGYDIGAGDAAELIDAFLARATAEGELTKTYFDLHVGGADLERAVGRLVPASDSAHGE